MRKYLLIATGVAVLAGTGAAFAQMPPGGGPNGPEEHGERWGGMRHMHHGRGDGAAFFRFRRGDAEMDIKCPAMENVQACVAAASTLMDKVASTQAPKTP